MLTTAFLRRIMSPTIDVKRSTKRIQQLK